MAVFCLIFSHNDCHNVVGKSEKEKKNPLGFEQRDELKWAFCITCNSPSTHHDDVCHFAVCQRLEPAHHLKSSPAPFHRDRIERSDNIPPNELADRIDPIVGEKRKEWRNE